MPFIEVKTTVRLDDQKRDAIKRALGKSISVIPGKSEGWLMVEIEDGKRIWFRGDESEDAAMVSVAVYGKLSDGDAERMTGEVTAILEREAGLSPDRVYVSYSEHDKWGWNGSNF